MKQFEYTVTNPVGIHARPAGLLVKKASEYPAVSITLLKGDKTADAKRLFSVMALCVKPGETVKVLLEGENEGEAAASLKSFFEANL